MRGGEKVFDLSHKSKLAYVSSTIWSKVMMFSTYNHKTKIEVLGLGLDLSLSHMASNLNLQARAWESQAIEIKGIASNGKRSWWNGAHMDEVCH